MNRDSFSPVSWQIHVAMMLAINKYYQGLVQVIRVLQISKMIVLGCTYRCSNCEQFSGKGTKHVGLMQGKLTNAQAGNAQQD